MMTRTPHFARDNITSLQVVFANFYEVNGANPDLGPGNAQTVTAAVEYPANTCHQIKFSSSTSGSIPNISYLLSDAVSVTIPSSALFWIREYTVSAGGTPIDVDAGELDSTDGEKAILGTSVADSTWAAGDTCPSFTSSSANTRKPMAIVAQTQRPTVCLLGDSRTHGYPGTASSTWPDLGDAAPSIGPTYAYLNLAINGDGGVAVTLPTHWANRGAMLKYCSNGYWAYGINDFSGSGTPAQELSYLAAVIAANPKLAWFTQTVSPHTSGPWTSLGTQAPVGNNANRVAYNDALRAGGITGVSGNFDLTAATESSLDSGLWFVQPGSIVMTSDGLHTNGPPTATSGSLFIKNSGVIYTSPFINNQ
jgi:hypothetical protein